MPPQRSWRRSENQWTILTNNLVPNRSKSFANRYCCEITLPYNASPSDSRTADVTPLSITRIVADPISLCTRSSLPRPNKIEDVPNEIIGKLDDELPNITKQISRGAKKYVLVTNLGGSSHLDSGAMDKVREHIEPKITVPFECYWRADLNRRMDQAWDLKWSYPQLLTGPDLLRAIIESGLSEHAERRTNAIRAFVKDQFILDEDVKFKQVDLHNKLTSLFTDVPLATPTSNVLSRLQHTVHARVYQVVSREAILDAPSTKAAPHAHRIVHRPNGLIDYFMDEDGTTHRPGAAHFILHAETQTNIPKMVLEGAPGQGKSTISQYVSQVHRMRLLGEVAQLSVLNGRHTGQPIRLPFKVDLRDLATWLSKRDPFGPNVDSGNVVQWDRTLEAFLGALVRHHSGGMSFTADDLVAVLKLSSALLVFDGLDEVADIDSRKEVVEELARGVRRLEANAASLQVVVTSRPAAFANSPGLPPETFPHYQLASLICPLIDEYATRWITSKQLSTNEAADVRRILRDKLDQPHIQELSRKPNATCDSDESGEYQRKFAPGQEDRSLRQLYRSLL